MKVVSIATLNTGGAGIAAFRLHLSLLKDKNIDASFLQKLYESVNKETKVDYVPERSSIFYRLQRRLRLTPEYKNSQLIQKYPRNHEYEIATFPTTSYRIEDHPLVKEADIIHLHWAADFLNYPTFFKKVKKPIVWTLHDMNAFQGVFHYQNDIKLNSASYSSLEEKVHNKKVQYLAKNNNIHIVTPSAWLGAISEQSKILGRYQHSVIPYGLDFDLYPLLEKDVCKETLSIDSNKPTILFVAHGLDIYRKGFDLLSEAIQRISSTDFNLISVGGDKITVDNSRVNHLHFSNINDISRLNTLYSAADMTILPSREDNLPNVMLESFANGIPIISFANGGMAEHIITGENGILVDTIGVDPLKKAIESFLNDDYTFDRDAIRQYAKDHFNEEQQALKYIELYKQILNK